ncbi:MAG TPA: hypothetical protein EYP22_03445, partial [Methanosarcinales archaeon]|nr:hypothetical protein [Methanosarcinales archaeon]
FSIDASDLIFTYNERKKTIQYTVNLNGYTGVAKGNIEITGAYSIDIPVTIDTSYVPITEAFMKIDDMQVKEGDSIEVPINITSANNLGSMDLLLSYDPNILEAIDVKKGSLTQNSNLEYKITNGTISISLIDLKGIQGSGDFIILGFKVIGSSGSASPILINHIEATDTNFNKLAINKESGLIIIETNKCGITGDVNGDGKVTSLDALMALQMSVGLIPVDQCADVNVDSKVTSLDALMILQASVGLITL